VSVSVSGLAAALAGGALIGLAAALLLVVQGRIAGISGIVAGGLRLRTGDGAWRWWFLAGLIGGGALLARLLPSAFPSAVAPKGPWAHPAQPGAQSAAILLLLGAGVLVGVGTRLGGGCTSGHGVCGLGRGSRRSLVAVLTFMATAALTVAVMRGSR
jgi:uncharacterized membrane protein YedE/YeeE